MLSNKLTFSLVLFLMLVFVAAGPVLAQLSPALNVDTDTAVDADGDGTADNDTMGRRDFVVYQKSGADTAANGIAATGVTTVSAASDNTNFPDLEDLLLFGGTIELLISTAPKPAEDATPDPDADPTHTVAADKEMDALHRLVISEIMWGTNATPAGGDTEADSQWIEIYNEGARLLAMDDVRLNFTMGRRVVRDKVELDHDADPANDDVNFAVVDRVSMVGQFGGVWADLPGSSGRTTADADNPVSNLISMYRKRSTSVAADGRTTYKYDKDGNPAGDKFGDGTDRGQWFTSPTNARINTSAMFLGSPGSATVGAGRTLSFTKAPASLPGPSGVIINEFYNQSEGNRMDWLELHNTTDEAVQVENWAIGVITKEEEAESKVVLPKHEIPAKGYLLIVNTDPAGEGTSGTILAGGVAVPAEDSALLAGAQHVHYIDSDFGLPNEAFLLILRSAKDKHGKADNVEDIAGMDLVAAEGTEVWPLVAWKATDFGKEADRAKFEADKVWSRKGNDANRLKGDQWESDVYKGGVGYDPNTAKIVALGTPGYPNSALGASELKQDETTKAYSVTNAVSVIISEIMYDAGEDGDTAQWIELYNPSLTDAVNLKKWTLEVRNKDSAESYVDSMIMLGVDDGGNESDVIILPNQTLLLVSYRGPSDGVPSSRVYNLWQHHKDELGLLQRRSILLSPAGFYLKLSYEQENNPDADADDVVLVDEAGNASVDGATLMINWDLEAAGRASLIRKKDGADGTAEDSWRMADGISTYYGHRDDMGSPGDHRGSPLPVSLSSFRPLRDKATGQVVITWVTESELNNAGFNILRREGKDGDFQKVNVKLIAGHGTTSEKHVYSYTDTTAKPNVVYYYQIEDVSLDGKHTTLRTTHLRGNVNAAGKVTTTWGDLKLQK